MPSKLNQLTRGELRDKLADVESGVFLDLTGINSSNTYAMRKLFNERNIELHMVKNSLAKGALTELGVEADPEMFRGPVAIAYNGDPVSVAKTVVEFRRTIRREAKLAIKGGFLARKAIDAKQVEQLAALPNRHQMLGQVVAQIAAPLTSFVRVYGAILRKPLYALNAIKEKREGQADAA